MTSSRYGAFQDTKRRATLERHTKGQFYKNTVYLKRGMPYFAFVSTNAVLVRKRRRTFGAHRPKAPSGRELPTESGEGERVTIELVQIQSCAGSFRHGFAVPPSSRRKAMLPPDSTPKRCNTLYLAGQACEKGQRRKISVLL